MKKLIAFALIACLMAAVFAGCGEKTETPSSAPPSDNAEIEGAVVPLAVVTGENKSGSYSAADKSGDYIGAVSELELSEETTVISSAGTYVLTGAGSVTIDCAGEVQLALNGADIETLSAGEDVAGLKVYITTENATANTLGECYVPNDLTFNGVGALETSGTVSAGGVLTVAGGNITSQAEFYAFNAGVFQMCGGDVTVTGGMSALNSNGDVYFDGGKLSVTDASSVISATEGVYINGGEIASENCMQGISGHSITVTGGVVDVTTSYNAMSAEAPAVYNWGENPGAIRIPEGGAVEGGDIVEGGSVDGDAGENEGDENVDPGFGVNPGGADEIDPGFAVAPPMGTNGDTPAFTMPEVEVDESVYVRVSGGLVCLNSESGGLYSGGNFVMDGGELFLGGGLGYLGEGAVSAGTLVVAGSSGSTGGLTDASTQNSFLATLSGEARAETELSVRDSSNNVILTHAFKYAYKSVLVSIPQLKLNGVYTVSADGKAATVKITQKTEGSTGGGAGNLMGGRGGRGGMGRLDIDPAMIEQFRNMKPGETRSFTMPDGTEVTIGQGEDGSSSFQFNGGEGGEGARGFMITGDIAGAIPPDGVIGGPIGGAVGGASGGTSGGATTIIGGGPGGAISGGPGGGGN